MLHASSCVFLDSHHHLRKEVLYSGSAIIQVGKQDQRGQIRSPRNPATKEQSWSLVSGLVDSLSYLLSPLSS